MQILKDLETAPIPLEEEERRHTRRLIVGVLVAVLVTAVLLGGFAVGLLFYKRHNQEVARGDGKTRIALPPKVEIFVDEATLKDKETLLGGTVRNISKEPLRNLVIELELKRRYTLDKAKPGAVRGGELERKSIPLDVVELVPDATGRYAITLSAKDYVTASLVRVVSGDNRAEVPFKTLPGTPRPLETPVPGKTITVKRPAPRGEQFINSPDKPERVP